MALQNLFTLLLNDRNKRLAFVAEPKMLDWQYPSLTEKQAYHNHIFHHVEVNQDHVYFAFPWATLIDVYLVYDNNEISLGSEFIETLKKEADRFKGRKIHTVCQHIKWKMLTELWEYVGIGHVHLSHCEYQTEDTEKLSFYPWTLIATNYENSQRSEGLFVKNNKDKNYLASFIGNHNDKYRSDIRKNLEKIAVGRSNICYELGEEWFYQRTVYHQQMSRKKSLGENFKDVQDLKTKRYNHVISDSVFSFCPEGTGPNTIRLWESMAVGSIPVIFADTWRPPQIKGLQWEDFSVRIPIENYQNTIEILESISAEKREIMKNNCLNAYKKFASIRCFT
jgi:hypothetical protein